MVGLALYNEYFSEKTFTSKRAASFNLFLPFEISPEIHTITKMANLTKFRQRRRLEQMSSREGYRQSGNFDESREFGENDEFDDMLPKIEN